MAVCHVLFRTIHDILPLPQCQFFVHVLCSVLTVVHYVAYMADLREKVDEYGVNYHVYVDDTQLYLHCGCDDTLLCSETQTLHHRY